MLSRFEPIKMAIALCAIIALVMIFAYFLTITPSTEKPHIEPDNGEIDIKNNTVSLDGLLDCLLRDNSGQNISALAKLRDQYKTIDLHVLVT